MAEVYVQREVDAFVASTPKSKALQDEAAQYLPGGSSRGTAYFAPYPTFVDHAKGHHVYDVDGNSYLDFMINATTHVMGHATGDHPASTGVELPRSRIAVHKHLIDAAARRLRRHDCPLAYHRHKLL